MKKFSQFLWKYCGKTAGKNSELWKIIEDMTVCTNFRQSRIYFLGEKIVID